MPKQALTDADIALLHDTFASKEDHNSLFTKVDLLPSKELFLSEMAKLMKEVKDMREDFTIVQGHKDQIEDHESRLEIIETKLTLTSN